MNDLFDRAAWRLAPDVLHLNHGSFGAVPNVVRAEQDRWRDLIDANPTGFFSRRLADELDVVRIGAAEFLHTDPYGLMLLPNVTYAAATVMASVPLERHDEVLITDDTYEAVRVAAMHACTRVGARLIQAGLPASAFGDGDSITQAIERALTPRTKLAIVDHITSSTAALIDPAPIVQLCNANGTAVFIDGAHAPGMLALDVGQYGADIYVGNFHKWCCAPQGAAFLAVAPDWRGRMLSPVPGSESGLGFPTGLEGHHGLLGAPLDPNRAQSSPDSRRRQVARAQRCSGERRRSVGFASARADAGGAKPDFDGDACVAIANGA
jgi:isopenicillin-N epimerase